ncbi:MAG: hypothetical protein ACJ795_21810, partial [Ktedonobacteraceae bacterium]
MSGKLANSGPLPDEGTSSKGMLEKSTPEDVPAQEVGLATDTPLRTENDSMADIETGHAVENIKPDEQPPTSMEDGATDIEAEQALEEASSEEEAASMLTMREQDTSEQDMVAMSVNGNHTGQTSPAVAQSNGTPWHIYPLKTLQKNPLLQVLQKKPL